MTFAEALSPCVPVAFFVTYSIIFWLALDLTQRNRILIAPLLLLSACGSFWTMGNLTWPEGMSSLWGLGLMVHVAHTTSVLYIETENGCSLPGSEELLSANSGPKNARTKYILWQDAQRLYLQKRKRITITENRRKTIIIFMAQRLAILLVYYLIHVHIAERIFPGAFIPFHPDEFGPTRQTYFRRLLLPQSLDPVTIRETMMRGAFVVYWLWTTFAMLSGTNIVLSLSFVALQLDQPEDWPQIFGSLLEAYSVRRFWGNYWHRIAVPVYASHSRFVIRCFWSFKPGSRVEKMLMALGIFAMSGISHALCSWMLGDDCYMGDFWFFMANFLAILLEVIISRLRSVFGSKDSRRSSLFLGYVWVFGFLFWLVPKWQYPKLYALILNHLA